MLQYWIWLAQHPHLNGVQKRTLMEYFSDPEDLYRLEAGQLPEELERLAPLVKKLNHKDLAEAERIMDLCREKNIRILPFSDPAYPQRLRQISDAPVVLYCLGTLPDLNSRPVIGVVGTRKATTYGMNTARQLSAQISACGALVISGGAAGIDTEAMRGALAEGAQTVGVLGCGVDVVYPKSNQRLFDEVIRNGCLLSEYPPQTPPAKWRFPCRNRIISGISNGVLVVEAPEKSGALITARMALDQGRDVYVVPGNIDKPLSAGSNALLGDRAMAACSGWDVVKGYTALYHDLAYRETYGKKLSFTRELLLEMADKFDFLDSCEETSERKNQENPSKKKKNPPETKIIVDNGDTDLYSVIKTKISQLPEEEQTVALALREDPRSADEIIVETGYPCAKVLSALTMLTLKGIAQNHPGNRVSLKTK